MRIIMPPMCGLQCHPNLMAKVERACAARDWPVQLDCVDTTFTTTMFFRFLQRIHKRVRAAGGTLELLNVDDTMYESLSLVGFLTLINKITRKPEGTDARKECK